jgi:hypothetical protein
LHSSYCILEFCSSRFSSFCFKGIAWGLFSWTLWTLCIWEGGAKGKILYVNGKVGRRWDLGTPHFSWTLVVFSNIELWPFFCGRKQQRLSFSLDLILINIFPNINLTTMPHRLPHRCQVTVMSPSMLTNNAYMNAPKFLKILTLTYHWLTTRSEWCLH